MPLSYEQVSGNGVTTNFAIPFQFLAQAHVHVLVDDVEILTHTWINSSTIQILPAPPSGTLNVEFRRTTPRDAPLVDFQNGSTLFDTDLDRVNLQALFIAQEMFEQAQNITFPSGHSLDSHSDASPGETRAKGTLRVFDENSLTKAVTLADGELLVGDSSDPRGVRALPLGNFGDALEVDTAVSGKISWKQGLRKLVTTVGDLLVATADETLARFGVGSTNQVLVADAASFFKMDWKSTLAGLTLTAPTLTTPTINSGGSLNGTLNVADSSVITGDGAGVAPVLNAFTITGSTINTSTINSPTITGNTVGTNALNIQTGTVSGTFAFNGATSVQIAANDYSFIPSARKTGGSGGADLGTLYATDYANTSGNVRWLPFGDVQGGFNDHLVRFRLVGTGSNSWNLTYTAQWRYFTASDNPTMWMVYDPATGAIISMWTSDDPLHTGEPGIIIPGFPPPVKLTSSDLEHIPLLSRKASEATALISEKRMRIKHLAFRALQLHSGENSPSNWLVQNLEVAVGGNNRLRIKRES